MRSEKVKNKEKTGDDMKQERRNKDPRKCRCKEVREWRRYYIFKEEKSYTETYCHKNESQNWILFWCWRKSFVLKQKEIFSTFFDKSKYEEKKESF